MILAKCEIISENANTNWRYFATFAKQYFVGSIPYYFYMCERKLENAKDNLHAFAAFAKEI